MRKRKNTQKAYCDICGQTFSKDDLTLINGLWTCSKDIDAVTDSYLHTPDMGNVVVADPVVVAQTSLTVKRHGYNSWDDNGIQTAADIELISRRTFFNVSERRKKDVLTRLVASDIKAYNPNIKLYRHFMLFGKDWDTDGDTALCAQNPITHADLTSNDWYLKVSGDIVTEDANTNWCTVTEAYANAFLAAALSRMTGEGWDGVCLDYLIPEGMKYAYTPAYIPDGFASADAFYTAWQTAIAIVVNGLKAEGYEVFGNCGGELHHTTLLSTHTEYTPYAYMRTLFDGTCYEQGFMGGWTGTDCDYQTSWLYRTRLTSLRDDPLNVWLSQNGLKSTATNFASKKRLCLASYMLVVPADQSNRAFNVAGDWSVDWDAEYDFDIGEPSAAFVQPDVNIRRYSRVFTQGMVYMNYEATPYIVSLAKQFVDYDGTNYAAGLYEIPAYTALILKEV